MSGIWNAILDGFEAILRVLHDALEVVFGVHAWGWAIILLTVLVRLILLPLAVKQTRSMRAMQELAPKLKAIQKKYPTDRDMLRSDPEKYRARKAKVNEETMALYREAGVNPAAGCLPLIAQMPIFFALFSLLRDSEDIADQPFYFFTSQIQAGTEGASGLGANGSAAGWPAILLIVMMAATMFITQRQMMGRNPQAAEGPQAQTQKIMLYVMPLMLGVFGFNLPLGVLLYWVTTNLWQMGQQWLVYRDLGPAPDLRDERDRIPKDKGSTPSRGRDRGASGGRADKPGAKGGPSGRSGGSGRQKGGSTSGDGRKKAGGSSNGRANGRAAGSGGKRASGSKKSSGGSAGGNRSRGANGSGTKGGKGGGSHLPGKKKSR